MAILDFHSDVMSLKQNLSAKISRLDNISAPDITACGIDLNPARLRLLCKNLSDNTYLGIWHQRKTWDARMWDGWLRISDVELLLLVWFPKEKEKGRKKHHEMHQNENERCIYTIKQKSITNESSFSQKKRVTSYYFKKNTCSRSPDGWWAFPSTSKFLFPPSGAMEKKHLRLHRSCRSIDLNRKGLIEEDGDSLAAMLEKNKGLRRNCGKFQVSTWKITQHPGCLEGYFW